MALNMASLPGDPGISTTDWAHVSTDVKAAKKDLKLCDDHFNQLVHFGGERYKLLLLDTILETSGFSGWEVMHAILAGRDYHQLRTKEWYTVYTDAPFVENCSLGLWRHRMPSPPTLG
jgi:hypothetical protein